MPEHRSPAEQAADLLRPILDVMAGVDGGVAYAEFHHQILPALIAHAAEGGDSRAMLTLDTVRHFSSICRILLSSREGE
jgi:hypothetical protein